jgi:hypothetical protein
MRIQPLGVICIAHILMCVIFIDFLVRNAEVEFFNKYFINNGENSVFGMFDNYTQVSDTMYTCAGTKECLNDACRVFSSPEVDFVVTRPQYYNCVAPTIFNSILPGIIMLCVTFVVDVAIIISFHVGLHIKYIFVLTWLTIIGIVTMFIVFVLGKFEENLPEWNAIYVIAILGHYVILETVLTKHIVELGHYV